MIRPAPRARVIDALPLVLVVVAVALFDIAFHEFWRDEAGAMLEARAVPWSQLLEAMHVEGVPPLFHALLKLAGLALPGPLALVYVGALGLATLLFGTYRLLRSLTSSPRRAARATLALSFTYTYAYELGAVIRQYTLGLGLALLSLAYLRDALQEDDRRSVRLGAAAAGLSALASAHSACVAGAGLLAFGVLAIGRRRSPRFFAPVFLTLPCFALVVYVALPYPLRTADANVEHAFPPDVTAMLSLQALVEGVMPSDWWLAESLAGAPVRQAAAVVRSAAFWGVVAGTGLALAARAGRRGRTRAVAFEVIAVCASWAPLLVITVQRYWGAYRHHLFLGVPLVIVLVGWGLDARVDRHARFDLRRTALALLAPWFALQIGLSAGDFALDARHPFSETKRAARLLPRGAHVAADAEWRALGMLLWRPDLVMRSRAWSGKRFRYLRPDKDWHTLAPMLSVLAAECRDAPDATFFAGYATSLADKAKCASLLPFEKQTMLEHPFTWETFDVFRVDCACVAEPAAK